MDAGLRERDFWSMTPCEIAREIGARIRIAVADRRLSDSRLAWSVAQLVAPHVKRGNPRTLLREYLRCLGVTDSPEKRLDDFADLLAESDERAKKAAVTNGHTS